MTYEEALERFKVFSEYCDNCSEACDRNCDKCIAMDVAIIKALEKQTPKKPIAFDKSWNGTPVYKCPVCDKPLGTKSFNEEQEQIGCARCLSAIDWNEVE